ncbi:MAG: hypothetical protein KKB51_04640 [Candidatus Riflebacteria bacterium]|nr:hypothetical protein [Candidatus Riflebacteria bacterium]
MKKTLLIAMPLFLTAAFSFPGFVFAQNIAVPAAVSESSSADKTTVSAVVQSPEDAGSVREGLLAGTGLVEEPVADLTVEKAPDADLPVAAVVEKDSAVDGVISEDSIVGSETARLGDETGQHEEIASQTEEIEPEPEKAAPGPFDGEPYTQGSLKDIEEHFEQSHKLAVKSGEFSRRALAIIAGTSDDRSFRRHCEFLARVANHNVYTVNAAMLVFPRLFEIGNIVCENTTRTLMHTFTNELIREPLAREIRLSELRNLLDIQDKLAQMLRKLSGQIADFCQQAGLQNSRRHVQGRIPGFLRATNRDMLVLLENQNSQLVALLNQFEHHYQFCLVNIDYFLAVSDHAPGVMQGSQLGRIFRSCNDFAFSLRNYREKFSVFAGKFEKLVQNRLSEIEIMAGKGSRRAARIAEFTDKYPDRDLDEAETTEFSAQQELRQSFVLLNDMLNQTARLAEGEVSAAASEADEGSAEAFALLQSTLDQHLDFVNWPIIEFDYLQEVPDIPYVTEDTEDTEDIEDSEVIKDTEVLEKTEVLEDTEVVEDTENTKEAKNSENPEE